MNTRMVHDLIFTQMMHHPLPWRIESDWTEEVTASDGYIIAKTDHHTALEMVALAEQMQKELVETAKDFEKELAETDADSCDG